MILAELGCSGFRSGGGKEVRIVFFRLGLRREVEGVVVGAGWGLRRFWGWLVGVERENY